MPFFLSNLATTVVQDLMEQHDLLLNLATITGA